MSETFWLAGCNARPADFPGILAKTLEKHRLRREWVQEIHHFGDPLPMENTSLAYSWPGTAVEQHRLLHLLYLAVQTHQPELVLITENINGQTAACLLGSARATGRRNLLPCASLHILLGHGHVSGISGFPNSRLNQSVACGLVYQLNQLIGQLQSSTSTAGVLQTLFSNTQVLATRVERI